MVKRARARVRRVVTALAVSAFALVAAAGCKKASGEDEPVNVVKDDPEMLAAFAAARATAPDFWRRFDSPADGETGFSVKVPVTGGGQTEYFWLTKLTKSGEKVSGSVDDDPAYVKTVSLGQRLDVVQSTIVDWIYMKNGKMYGNYTIRPLFKTMSPAEVQQMKAVLAEP
jgi:uncharacterized protein YegJ (DUF2314 family)